MRDLAVRHSRSCVRTRPDGVYLHSSDSHQSISRCRCSSHGINASSSRSSRLAGEGGWRRGEEGRQDNKMKWLKSVPQRATKHVGDGRQEYPNCYFLQSCKKFRKIKVLLWKNLQPSHHFHCSDYMMNPFLCSTLPNQKDP